MINIFFIVHDFSGAKTYSDELEKYFEKMNGINIYKIYINHPLSSEFKIENIGITTSVFIPSLRISKDETNYYKRAAQLLYSHFNYLNNIILHANHPEQYFFAKEIINLFHCPFVYTLHFLSDFYSYFDKVASLCDDITIKGDELLKSILEIANHVICVTEFGHRVVKYIYGIDDKNVSVIYNGIGQPEFKIYDKKKLKRVSGFNLNDILILYVGKLETRKGIDKLIGAYSLIKDKYPKAKLIIAGDGDFSKYMPLAINCLGRVIFTGKLDKETLYRLYRISDLGVIPSQYEQCSYVAIEMMQCALPLIISDVPGLNELVENGKSGLICEIQSNSKITNALEVNERDLAAKMETLIVQKNYATNLALTSLKRLSEVNSLKKMGNSTFMIYRNLIYKKSFIN
jgi:glycosyltransferase involved in cell wall biosynthesis